MRTFHVVLGLGVAVTLGLFAWAAKVQTWKQDTQADFERGKFTHTVVTSRGAVQLGRELQPWTDIKAQFVWDLGSDAKGNVYAATGEPGKVFKLNAEGKIVAELDTKQQHVFSIAVAPDGTAYAGTGPEGIIFKITPDGKLSEFCKTNKKYIWDLALGSNKVLYAAAGTQAEVLKISPDGKCSSLLKAKQKHMMSVALGKNGIVYAGTDTDGLVYKIDAKGRAFVLYDAREPEIRSLLAAADGALYVGTSSATGLRVPFGPSIKPSTRPSSTSSGSSRTINSGKNGAIGAPPAAPPKRVQMPRTPTSSAATRRPSAPTRPSTTAVPPGTNAIYRIAPDGAVVRLTQQKLMMLCMAELAGRLIIGTGQSARLLELDDSGPLPVVSSLARIDHEAVLSMTSRPDGSIVFGTGDPGKLYVLGTGYARKGTYLSQVFDSGMTSYWGSIAWRANVPPGTKVTLAVRTGNVSKPDDTWSDWSPELIDPEQSRVPCPAARFLQFRATLETTKPGITPTLESVKVRYATVNQPPVITKIDVPDPSEGDGGSQTSKIKVKWSAQDPNKDTLRFQLWCQKQGWNDWVRIAKELSKPEYDWNIAAMPEGHYRLKVVASDVLSNPANRALQAELVSDTFVIDHTAPSVRARVVSNDPAEPTIEVQAQDSLTRIARAAYSVDSGSWQPIFPIDLLFDSKRETLRFTPNELSEGAHVIVVRVTDAAGNTATADLVVTVPKAN